MDHGQRAAETIVRGNAPYRARFERDGGGGGDARADALRGDDVANRGRHQGGEGRRRRGGEGRRRRLRRLRPRTRRLRPRTRRLRLRRLLARGGERQAEHRVSRLLRGGERPVVLGDELHHLERRANQTEGRRRRRRRRRPRRFARPPCLVFVPESSLVARVGNRLRGGATSPRPRLLRLRIRVFARVRQRVSHPIERRRAFRCRGEAAVQTRGSEMIEDDPNRRDCVFSRRDGRVGRRGATRPRRRPRSRPRLLRTHHRRRA